MAAGNQAAHVGPSDQANSEPPSQILISELDCKALASWENLEAWSTVQTICLYYIKESNLNAATECLTGILRKAVNCKNVIFQDFNKCLNIWYIADDQLDIDKAFGAFWKAVTEAKCSLEALTVCTPGFTFDFMIRDVPKQDAQWTERLKALTLESSVFGNIFHFIERFPRLQVFEFYSHAHDSIYGPMTPQNIDHSELQAFDTFCVNIAEGGQRQLQTIKLGGLACSEQNLLRVARNSMNTLSEIFLHGVYLFGSYDSLACELRRLKVTKLELSECRQVDGENVGDPITSRMI